jgi:hypothetical protein
VAVNWQTRDLQIGDFVEASVEAQLYYSGTTQPDFDNSDYRRRTLKHGEVVCIDFYDSQEPTVHVRDLDRGFMVSMRPSMLAVKTYIIPELLFDLPQPTYRHF